MYLASSFTESFSSSHYAIYWYQHFSYYSRLISCNFSRLFNEKNIELFNCLYSFLNMFFLIKYKLSQFYVSVICRYSLLNKLLFMKISINNMYYLAKFKCSDKTLLYLSSWIRANRINISIITIIVILIINIYCALMCIPVLIT